MGGLRLPWATAVPTTLACRRILAFGLRCYNHKHQLQVGRYTTRYNREERSASCVRAGRKAGTRTRIMRLSVARTDQLYYLSIWWCFFICPRKHQTRVCKFYLYPTYQKVLALRLIELTCSIYIPYPAFGRYSIQLLRTSSYLLYLLTYADLRHTNCLIFAHIRPVRRHGLSHR